MNEEFPQSFRAPYTPVPDVTMEVVNSYNETTLEGLQRKAKYDRYFLAKGILGYQDVNPYTHGPLCRALEDRSRQRRMFLQHRGSLKTTLGTITDCVGDALEDTENCRILIVNEIELNAVGFLSEIKAHFQNSTLLRKLFPSIIPERFVGPGSHWSNTQACLNRSTAYKEWTWSAAGVGKALAGNHYTKIKCDDLIGFEARESPAAMRYAVAFAKALEPLLIDMDRNFIDFVGTRWSLHDLYRIMLDAYGEDMSYFAREDIEFVPEMEIIDLRRAGFGYVGKDMPELGDESVFAKVGTLQPIFPKKFSLKKLNRLSVIDPVLYYAQYKNNPIADGTKDFDASRLGWFDFDDYGNVVYRESDGVLRRWNRDQLDIVMTVDPNSGELSAKDLPAIVVSAQSPKDQIFVFETWARRVLPDAFVLRIFELWEKWQPRVCGIEKAGQQSTLFYFKKLAKERKTYINVVPLTPRNRDKAERIRKALQPIIAEKRMYLRKTQTSLRHQIQFHPDIENDDEVDALAYGTEVWKGPVSAKEQQDADDAAEAVLATRNPITGY